MARRFDETRVSAQPAIPADIARLYDELDAARAIAENVTGAYLPSERLAARRECWAIEDALAARHA